MHCRPLYDDWTLFDVGQCQEGQSSRIEPEKVWASFLTGLSPSTRKLRAIQIQLGGRQLLSA